MKTILSKLWTGISVLILISALVIILFIFKNKNGDYYYFTANKEDLIQSIELAGQVKSTQSAELSFEVSGTVKDVFVEIGDEVKRGDILVALDTTELEADLLDAKSLVNIKEAELLNADRNLRNVTEQQNVLVENAKRKLLSDELEAIPRSNSTDLDAPIITGLYSGESGQYKVEIEKENIHDLNYSIDVFGIERFKGIIQSVKSNPLGTLGLFIQLPSDPKNYADTVWYIDIPNSKGDNYTDNLNTYNAAIENKNIAIREAEKQLDPNSLEYSILESELIQAKSRVTRIENEINKRRLNSPFEGTISVVNIETGEIAGSNQNVISLVSDKGFEVRLNVPEIDIAKVHVGEKALISIDAYEDDLVWGGKVINFSQGENYVDGVPVYETIVAFDNSEDDRLRSGLNATVNLITDSRNDVVSVPKEFIQKDGRGTFVMKVIGKDKLEITYIQTGLEATNGMVEITDGLIDGDVIAKQKIKK